MRIRYSVCCPLYEGPCVVCDWQSCLVTGQTYVASMGDVVRRKHLDIYYILHIYIPVLLPYSTLLLAVSWSWIIARRIIKNVKGYDKTYINTYIRTKSYICIVDIEGRRGFILVRGEILSCVNKIAQEKKLPYGMRWIDNRRHKIERERELCISHSLVSV